MPPTPPIPAIPTSLPCFQPPLGFVHVSFIVVPENLSPFSPVIPSHLSSGYCQIVLNFSVSSITFLEPVSRMCLILSMIFLWERLFCFHISLGNANKNHDHQQNGEEAVAAGYQQESPCRLPLPGVLVLEYLPYTSTTLSS